MVIPDEVGPIDRRPEECPGNYHTDHNPDCQLHTLTHPHIPYCINNKSISRNIRFTCLLPYYTRFASICAIKAHSPRAFSTPYSFPDSVTYELNISQVRSTHMAGRIIGGVIFVPFGVAVLISHPPSFETLTTRFC